MTWWESWFGEEYLDLYPHRDLASARREAAFALAHLPAAARAAARPLLRLGPALGPARRSRGRRRSGSTTRRPLLDLARRRDRHLSSCAATCARCPSGRHLPRGASTSSRASDTSGRRPRTRRRRRDRARAAARAAPFSATPSAATTCSRASCRRSAGAAATSNTASAAPGTPRPRRLEKEIEVRRAGSTEIFRESVRAYAPRRARRACSSGAGLARRGGLGRLRRVAAAAPIRRA